MIYCGAPPNQQLLPAVRFLMSPANFYFFRDIAGANSPVLTVSIGEHEAALMDPKLLAGHMVAWTDRHPLAVRRPYRPRAGRSGQRHGAGGRIGIN